MADRCTDRWADRWAGRRVPSLNKTPLTYSFSILVSLHSLGRQGNTGLNAGPGPTIQEVTPPA